MPEVLRKSIAFICAVSVVFAAIPPAGAAPAGVTALIGNVSAVGSAEVRGIRTREATLFSGDQVRSLENSYTKIFLNGGHRVELSANTQVRLEGDADRMKIGLFSGRMNFASSPGGLLELDVQSLSILAKNGDSGAVASTSKDLVSVAAVKGQLQVKDLETGKIFSVLPGSSTVFGLHGREPVAESAALTVTTGQTQTAQQSTPPQQDPAVVRIPAPSSKPPGGLSTATKVLIVAGIGGAAAAVAVFASGKNDETPASPSSPR